MKYIYSATFVPTGEGTRYLARVPDLPGCITTGSDLQDAILQISDAAAGWLTVAEDEALPIPPATPQSALDCVPGCTFSLIQIDTLAYRALTDNRSVRKNVSLPAWMADLAERRGINCSQVLQEGLRARLSSL